MGKSKEDFLNQREFEESQNVNQKVKQNISFIDQVEEWVNKKTISVMNEEIEALDTYAIMGKLEALFKDAKATIKNMALEEALQYPEKLFSFKGITFEKREGRATYSFKHIPEVVEAELFTKDLKDKYKSSLIAKGKGIIAVDEETGEELPMAKVSYSQDVLIVKKWDNEIESKK